VLAGTLAMLVVAIPDYPASTPLPGITLFITCALGLVLAATGLADDIKPQPARYRFGAQTAVVCLLLWALGLEQFPAFLWLDGWLLGALLLLAGLWWINLFNFMDGIDGIASVQAICMLMGAAGIALLQYSDAVTSAPLWQIMLLLSAAVLGFLLLNWSPASIFMGDVGSTWLAFMLLFTALASIQAGWLNYESWMLLGALFITDASITLLRRMANGERWAEAHRSHAYQQMSRSLQAKLEQQGRTAALARSGSHQRVSGLVIGVNGLWLLPLAGFSVSQPDWAWVAVLVGYGPLVAGVVWLRAGKD